MNAASQREANNGRAGAQTAGTSFPEFRPQLRFGEIRIYFKQLSLFLNILIFKLVLNAATSTRYVNNKLN